MRNFYLKIWLFWLFWVTQNSIKWAFSLSLVLTLITYFSKNTLTLNGEILGALFNIGKFYFTIFWGVTFLISLFLASRKVLNRCYNNYSLAIFRCDTKEQILDVKLDDVIKLWRKWLFMIIWIVSFFTILGMIISYIFSNNSPMSWFNIYWLYIFVMLSGIITIPLISLRCKMVKLQRC